MLFLEREKRFTEEEEKEKDEEREREEKRKLFIYKFFQKNFSFSFLPVPSPAASRDRFHTPTLSLYSLLSTPYLSLSLSFFFYLFSSLISSFGCSLRLSIIRFSFSFFSLNNIPHALLCNVKDTLSIQQPLSSSSSIFFFFSFHLRIYSLLVNVYKFFLENYEKYSILKK